MKVFGLTIDPFTNAPIVILKDLDEKNALPVWIGVLEASSIAAELEKIHFTRPMTHDLVKEMLKNLEIAVTRVEVNDLRDNVYYATIHMRAHEKSVVIDARPSDAIALALRMSSPIYVDTRVLDKSRNMEARNDSAREAAGESARKDPLDVLSGLEPNDFGKYKM